jgi:hypothetical protein
MQTLYLFSENTQTQVTANVHFFVDLIDLVAERLNFRALHSVLGPSAVEVSGSPRRLLSGCAA